MIRRNRTAGGRLQTVAWAIATLVGLVSGAALLACSSASDESTPTASSDEAATLSVTDPSQPATVEHASGAKLVVPGGALNQSAELLIEEVPAPAQANSLAGPAFEFSVGAASLAALVTITIPFNESYASRSGHVIAVRWISTFDVWEPVPLAGTQVDNTLVVEVDHLSIYSTSFVSDANPDVQNSSLRPHVYGLVAPTRVVSGHQFDVHFVVENLGIQELVAFEGDSWTIELTLPDGTRAVQDDSSGVWDAGAEYTSTSASYNPFSVTAPAEVGALGLLVTLSFTSAAGDTAHDQESLTLEVLPEVDVPDSEAGFVVYLAGIAPPITYVNPGKPYDACDRVDDTFKDELQTIVSANHRLQKVCFSYRAHEGYLDSYTPGSTRQHLSVSARALNVTLRDLRAAWLAKNESEPVVVLVAHSLGGAVAATWAADLDTDQDLLELVRGVITFDSPVAGISGVRAHFGGDAGEDLRSDAATEAMYRGTEAVPFYQIGNIWDGTVKYEESFTRPATPEPRRHSASCDPDPNRLELETRAPLRHSCSKEDLGTLALVRHWMLEMHPEQSGQGQRATGDIAFTACLGPWREGCEVFVAYTDGAPTIQLTDDTGVSDGEPIWSPDGARIAFVSYNYRPSEYGSISLRIMNADGSQTRELATEELADSLSLRWSTDGSAIRYKMCYPEGICYQHAVPTDGSTPPVVTHAPTRESRRLPWPTESRSGEYFLDVAESADLLALSIHSSSGHFIQRIAELTPRGDRWLLLYVAWSPDDSRIAFSYGSWNEGSQVIVLNVDGSGQEQVSTVPLGEHARAPVWSPDGQHIAYLTADGPEERLVLFSFASKRERVLATGETLNSATFSPSGDQLVLVRGIDREPASISIIDIGTGIEASIGNDIEPYRISWGVEPAWRPW